METELFLMKPGAIPLVFLKSVMRKDFCRLDHESIPVDFGDHAGGGDGKAQSIAIDNALVGNGKGL
jgi:hypothetical protein